MLHAGHLYRGCRDAIVYFLVSNVTTESASTSSKRRRMTAEDSAAEGIPDSDVDEEAAGLPESRTATEALGELDSSCVRLMALAFANCYRSMSLGPVSGRSSSSTSRVVSRRTRSPPSLPQRGGGRDQSAVDDSGSLSRAAREKTFEDSLEASSLVGRL